jgi:hypothetical protein
MADAETSETLFKDAQRQLALYDSQALQHAIPGDRVGASYTAHQCGVDAAVIGSLGLWATVQTGQLRLKDVMLALAAAGASACE